MTEYPGAKGAIIGAASIDDIDNIVLTYINNK